MQNELTSSALDALLPTESPRQRAGRANQLKSNGLTPAGREALREATLRYQPWQFSTGPKTAEGKRRSSRNAVKTGMARELMLIREELETIGAILRQFSRMSDKGKSETIRRGLI